MMNDQLRLELLSMQQADQRLLRELLDAGELSEGEYHPRLKELHGRNNARIASIIDEHGWPGISLVGEAAAKAAWLIVQHAVLDTALMERVLSLLNEAVDHAEAEGWCLAYLQDRVLTLAGKPQIYGSQHDFDENGTAYPLPMAEPGKVDQLRAAMGMEPLAEATRRIQARYRSIIDRRKGPIA